MFRLLSFLSIFFFITSCNGKGSTADKPAEELLDTVYTIAGVVKGAPDSTLVTLHFFGVKRKADTTFTRGEKFEFKGSSTDPVVGGIYVFNESHDGPKPLYLVVENAVINVEGEKDKFHEAIIIGGIRNSDFIDLKKMLAIYEDSLDVVMRQLEEANGRSDTAMISKLNAMYSAVDKEKSTTLKQYLFDHPKSIGAAFYLTMEYNLSPAQFDSIYKTFDSSILTNVYVNKIKTLVEASKRTAIDQPAPDFESPDVQGKKVALSSFKNKYLLVDFWASWCAPCREENPNLVAAYKKYKSKGFEILSVSLDDDEQAWRQAIAKDKLTWTNVSNLKGWETDVVPLYGIRGIPTSYLLDKEGKIIAADLRGADLDKKLAELLK